MNVVFENGTARIESRDFPTNKGGLCQKGWTAADLLGHPERLTAPLIRANRSQPFRVATWEEALDRIVTGISATQQEYGRDAVGVFGGGGLTNEKAYLLGKFARVALQTSQIDYNGRFCMASSALASIKAFGVDRGLPFPLSDIPLAQTILLVGSNVAETMPPVMQYFDQQRKNGGSLIVVDPRRTPTATAAQIHLQLTPGTDAALANGLLHLAIQNHYLDEDFIAARTSGFEKVRQTVASYWPGRVERITGVSERLLVAAARQFGNAKRAMILTARGPEQQSQGVENVLAFINLALAHGRVGKPNCGYGTITGQGNGQGGREQGQKADQLPGYRKIDNPAHREHMAGIWNVPVDHIPGPGKSAYEMLAGMGEPGGLRALLVFASNPVVSAPRSAFIEEKLRSLNLLVVSDIFLSETAALADVVLPCTQWAEEEGTMTNVEGRILLRQVAAAPPSGVRSDLEIMAAIAARLGYPKQFPAQPSEVFQELRRASAGGVSDYAGVTYERIRQQDGVFWPCPSEYHPGTPRLFADEFPTNDGRARFHAVEFRESSEQPNSQFPLYLTTGRVMAQYQSGTQTRRVKKLNDAAPEAFVEIHPAMAAGFGITEGDAVTLTTARGSATAKAVLTQTIRMDTVFVPFHFAASARANLLTNPKLDPLSKMPDFKVCAVRIEKGPLC
jgi:assimilatory nitrate reductase catalytic subunit